MDYFPQADDTSRRRFCLSAAAGVGSAFTKARPSQALSASYGDMINLETELDMSREHDIGPVITRLAKTYPGRPFFLTNKVFQLRSRAIVDGPPLTILGSGSGIGPGPAAQDQEAASSIVSFFAGDDAITVTSLHACVFRDFRVGVWPEYRRGPGACIKLSGPAGATNFGSEVSNVALTNRDYCLHILRAGGQAVRKCYFDSWVTAGVYVEADTKIEGGGGFVSESTFFGGAVGSGLLCETGYVDIHDNLFIGGMNGIAFHFKRYPAGAPRAYRNSIEENREFGIHLISGDGAKAGMVDIVDNEFSNVAYCDTFRAHVGAFDGPADNAFETLRINGNTMRSRLPDSARFIIADTRSQARIESNTIVKIGPGACVGIEADRAGATPHIAKDNEIVLGAEATPFVKYRCRPRAIRVIDTAQGTSFERLALDYDGVADGSEVYVTDGKHGASPLAGAGSGTRALRVGGRWFG